MNGLLGVLDSVAQHLIGAVGNGLINVHVVAGACPSLDGVNHKLAGPLPGQHLVGGVHNRLGDLGGANFALANHLILEQTQVAVHFGSGPLDGGHGPHEGRVGPEAGDGEIVNGSLGLSTPVSVGGDLNLAQRVFFNAIFRHGNLAAIGLANFVGKKDRKNRIG